MNFRYINNKYIFSISILLVFIVLTVISLNNGYFGDNIQQISKEAHWFYQNNFSALLMPPQDSGFEIVATGYHPPLMGIMTAFLWKIFGYKLWVSHVFALFWASILIYNSWKLIRVFFQENLVGWVLLILLLEPTVLTQFTVASPDFILLTAFVVSLRAVFERKTVLLSIGLFFLFGINMRGIFAGSILFVVYCYHSYLINANKISFTVILKNIVPFLPVVLVLTTYFIYYFYNLGWFFTNQPSSGHYAPPTDLMQIVKHFAAFGLRSVENGRIVVWILGLIIVYKILKNKFVISPNAKVLLLSWTLLTGLYVVFVFLSQLNFFSRYFIQKFFFLTVLVILGVNEFVKKMNLKIIFVLFLFFEITGNFWIYPGKIAKSWDSTLAHLSYYEVREQCFDYIDQNNIDYSDISSGFGISGNRKFAELKNEGKIVGIDPQREYFIYSNISNLEDELAEEFENRKEWSLIKRFEKGYVFIEVLKKIPKSTSN